jgi:hypothetical protein
MASLPVQFRGVILDGMVIPGGIISYLSLPDTATLAQMSSALGVWAAAVDGTIDGAFQQVFATLAPTLPGGLKAATGATWLASRISQTGVISFSATGTDRRYGQAIPTLSNTAIVAGQVNIADAGIAALIALLLNPTGFFTNVQSESLVAALDALLSFRKRSIIGLRSQRV